MRFDLAILQEWITPSSRVLDLGCGRGQLLAELKRTKNVIGYGIEIDHDNIEACIAAGVNVIEQNVDLGLENFPDYSFDTVVMSQTLQAVRYPERALTEMLRIGRECIVSFPNFGHWRCRHYLTFKGEMPVSELMPYTWYDTPNIHFCTVDDFEALCAKLGIKILNRRYVQNGSDSHRLATLWPNMLAETAIYRLSY